MKSLILLAIAAITTVHCQQQRVLVLENQQPPVGQESVATDLLSTIQASLSGLLPSLPTLSTLNPTFPCLGLTSLTSGRCLSSDVCQLTGGSDDKGCLIGGHVCCIPPSRCGAVISSADAWISNDEYPNATMNGQSCAYTINKASPVIGQLRIEMDKLELASSADCSQDKLVIDDVTGVNLFPICGLASGGHLIVPFSSNSLTLRVIVGDKVVDGTTVKDGQVVDGNGNLMPKVPRKWRIRITQFANNGPNIAPAGCTQLFSADGSISSLGHGTHVNGQKYAICFQKKAGMCGLKFDLTSLQPKGLLEQIFTPVERTVDSKPGREHQQPMNGLPLEPQPLNVLESHNMEKRQANPLNPLNLPDPLGLLNTLEQQKLALLNNVLEAKKEILVEKIEKVEPPPKPQPYHQPYGNNIYHQPAQHHQQHHHQQQHHPQVQPWQHAHKPAYGGHYGHQYAPMPEPVPVKPKEILIEKVVEVPKVQQVTPTVTKTLNVETGLPGLLDINNSLSLQVPKTLAQGLVQPLAPLVPPVLTPATPLVVNNLPDGLIQETRINPVTGQQEIVVRQRQRNKRSEDGQDGGQAVDGQQKNDDDIVKCTRTMFLAPTSTSHGGHLVCLEEGKYTGPTEVVVIGEPLVAFVEIAAPVDGTSNEAITPWNIPFSFVPC